METLETLYAGMFNEHDNIQAARGCNQYKHVQGCQDAGPTDSTIKNIEDFKKLPYEERVDKIKGKFFTAVDKETGKTIHHQLTYEQASAVISWGEIGITDDGRFWVMNGGNKYIMDDKLN